VPGGPVPRILILAGGLSLRRDVSLRSAAGSPTRCVMRVRGSAAFDVDASLLDTLRGKGTDVVWPLLHGASGRTGRQDVLRT
jgi:D-alanine-D-alanine ligase